MLSFGGIFLDNLNLKNLCRRNVDVCRACRKKEKCSDDCCTEQSICRLIESIALEEAGLAHILNAEGEKLQKAVKLACSINDLLKVNQSIIRTINSVTQLEQALLAKLQAAIDLRDHPCCGNPLYVK